MKNNCYSFIVKGCIHYYSNEMALDMSLVFEQSFNIFIMKKLD